MFIRRQQKNIRSSERFSSKTCERKQKQSYKIQFVTQLIK